MNLLLTNDDGYSAIGINVLLDYLSKKHNVFVVAPEGNRSAVSHCITMHKNLVVKQYDKNVWSCSGSPVDCVVTALKSSLLPTKIDAVISGINAGANIGTDILYSGTCAAAREGVLHEIPSVAFSLDITNEESVDYKDFEGLADFALKNLESLISLSKTDRPYAFVNVNGLAIPEYKGAVLTKELSHRKYEDFVKLEQKIDCMESVFQGGLSKSSCDVYSDYYACSNGYVAISCVYAEPLACNHVDGIKFSL